jgi:protein-tyrosine phosphatase
MERSKGPTLHTSTSDPIRVDFLPPLLPGGVGLTFAPGKCDGTRWQRSVRQDLDRLRAHYGVSHLVSLIEDHELVYYQIENLYVEAERRQIAVHRLPIRDVSVPPKVEDVASLVRGIGSWAANGQTVVIHCIGGLGRTGTVAGCFLVEQGFDAEAALNLLREVRAVNCPETDEQREFVRRYDDWRKRPA